MGGAWGPGPEDRDSQVAQVFREHAAVVARVAERAAMGNHALAEDATQQAFIEAVCLWPGFWEWPSAKQRAWLCERARNRVIDNWRATRRELAAESLPEERAARSAEEITLSRVALERCLEAIGSMPERARQAAYLKWHEEWTMTEIAGHLGVDRATVLRDLRGVAAAVKEKAGDDVPFPVGVDDGEEA